MSGLSESGVDSRGRDVHLAPRARSVESQSLRVGFASSSERERVLDWLDAGLRPGRPGRLLAEYPRLLAPDSDAVPIAIWTDGRPAAFCILAPSRFAVGPGALRAGMISLVYTDPRDRGRGLAGRVLVRAREEARRLELGLLLLWSDLDALYQAQGFSRAGLEHRIAFDADVLLRAQSAAGLEPPVPPVRVERGVRADWASICRLRQERTCTIRHADAEARLLDIPELDTRVVRSADGTVLAFAMLGRGDDFPGVVHEWAGDPVHVLRCLAALLAEHGRADGLVLLAPPEPRGIARLLRCAGARLAEEPLAWFRVASPIALANDLATILPLPSDFKMLERPGARADSPRIAIRARPAQLETELEIAERDLLALLFTRDASLAYAHAPAPAARQQLARLLPPDCRVRLPLPFFVWGLESI